MTENMKKQHEKIRKLRAEGMSWGHLRKKLKVSNATISAAIKGSTNGAAKVANERAAVEETARESGRPLGTVAREVKWVLEGVKLGLLSDDFAAGQLVTIIQHAGSGDAS